MTKKDEPNKWITVTEAASYYDVTASTVKELAKMHGVKYRVTKDALEYSSEDLHTAADLAGWLV